MRFPHTESLVVENLYVCFEGAWKLVCNAPVYIVKKMAKLDLVINDLLTDGR